MIPTSLRVYMYQVHDLNKDPVLPLADRTVSGIVVRIQRMG